MAIFLTKDSKVIVQGITGGEGTKHTALMLKAGTQVVGGVNARKAGTTVSHTDKDGNAVELPVYGTVAEAMKETGADVSIAFVPPAFAKDAIVEASETGTVLLNRHTAPAVRVLRTEVSETYEFDTSRNAMEAMARYKELYFGGDLSAGLPFSGQVAGRIDAIRPVAEILAECAHDCLEVLHELAHRYPLDSHPVA